MHSIHQLKTAFVLGLAIAGFSTTASAGTPPNVEPGTVINVFLAGGQSNMRGRAGVSGLPLALQGEQADVLLVRGSSDRVGTALDYLQPNYVADDGATFGPEVTFGRTIKDANPDANFAILKYSKGGTSLGGNWRPPNGTPGDLGGDQYKLFKQTVANGLTELTNAGYTPNIIGMLWHQGESDSGKTQQQYEDILNGFIADIRGTYGMNLPFMIGEINADHPTRTGYANISAAQAAVGAADPYATFVDTIGSDFGSDDVHFDAAGMIKLGNNFATQYQADYGGLIVVPEPSSLLLLSLGGLMLTRRRRSASGL